MSAFSSDLIAELSERARQIRRDTVEVLATSTGGHYGGAFSCAEILSTFIFHQLKMDPKNPEDPNRDRFILAKGHVSVAYCSALAHRGFFPYEDVLEKYNKLGSPFAMHPDMHLIPGCDMSTGSLGHGLAVSVGMALAARLDGRKHHIYVMMGDADMQEGSTWEAANSAGKYKLDNLTVVVDRNMITMDGFTEELMPLEPAQEKWRSFNWAAREIDGHNLEEILESMANLPLEKGRPSVIIAKTVKGKGVSFLENRHQSHFIKLTPEQTEQCFKEIG